jgi:enamine deaminase RidA (YjgF/YER057c/UK114 family)
MSSCSYKMSFNDFFRWACDNTTGELTAGTAGDYRAQSKITWEHVVGILKELGLTFKDIVHRTTSFKYVFTI